MRRSCEEFIEEGGITIHPEPQHYGFLGILMQKLGKASMGIAKFLKKFWYPTWVLKNASNDKKLATYYISVPPSKETTFYIDILMKICRIKREWIQVSKIGAINQMEPRIFGVMNLCTVTFCEGQSFALQV